MSMEQILFAMAASGGGTDLGRMMQTMVLMNAGVPAAAKVMVASNAVDQERQAGQRAVASKLDQIAQTLVELEKEGALQVKDKSRLRAALPEVAFAMDLHLDPAARSLVGGSTEGALLQLLQMRRGDAGNVATVADKAVRKREPAGT